MNQTKPKSTLDLTWILYVGYALLAGCSFWGLPEILVTPGLWAVNGMLIVLNTFLALGLMMVFYALKQIKANPQAVKLTVDKRQQFRFAWALFLEVGLVYVLTTGPLKERLGLLVALVLAKVILTMLFLLCHRVLRKYLSTGSN